MELNIDSDDLREAVFDGYDNLSDALQAAFRHGTFDIPEGTFMGDGMVEHTHPTEPREEPTLGEIGDGILAHLRSLPVESVGRCALGLAFEDAVINVLMNVLRGEELHGSWDRGEVQRALAVAIRSVDQWSVPTEDAITVPDTDVPLPETPAAPMGYAREVAVFTMNGQRDGMGSAHVWASPNDETFLVTRDGTRWAYNNALDAFSKALGLTAWSAHAARGRIDPTPNSF